VPGAPSKLRLGGVFSALSTMTSLK